MSNSKNRSKRVKSVRILQAAITASVFVIPLFEVGSVQAATKYWDINGTTAGAGGANPSGSWDTTTTSWSTSSAGTAAATTFATGDTVFFSAGTDATGAFTVTVAAGGVSAGIILIEEAGSPTFTGGPITITGGGTNIEPGGGTVANTTTFSSAIAGTVGLRILRNSGTPNVVIFNSTADSFTGGVTLGLGCTLRAGAAGVIPSTNEVHTNSGGTLDLGSNAQTIAGISATALGGDILLGSATLTLTGAANATFQGDDITGTGGVTLNGGSQTLSTNYGFTGPLKINGGFLEADSLNAAGSSSSLGKSTTANSAANLVLNGGTLVWLGKSTAVSTDGLTTNRAFTLGASGGTIDSESSIDACTFSGAMTNSNSTGTQSLILAGSGTFGNLLSGVIPDGTGTAKTAVVKNGTGTWVLGSATANTYTGGTTINGGTLRLASASAIPSATAVTVAGGTLDLNGQNISVGSVALNSGSIIGNSTLTSATDFAVQSGTVTATLAGTVGLNKTTAGTATITGNVMYTGNTTVSGGTLFFNGGNTQSAGTIDVLSTGKVGGTSFVNGPVTIESGGHFIAGNGHGTGTTALSASGAGTIEFKAGSNLDFTVLSGGGSDILDASSALPNALTFDGTAGQTSLNIAATGGGTYPIIFYNGSYGTPGNIGTNEFTTAGNVTLSDDGFSTISATVTFNQTEWQNPAGGDWFLGTNWNAGIPNGSGATALFGNNITTNQSIDLSASATVGLLTFDNTNGARYTLSTTAGSTLTMSSPGTATILDNNGNHTINVGVQLSNDTLVTVTHSGDSLSFGGAITGSGALTTAGAGNVSFSNTVADSAGITNSGSGSLSVSGAISGAGGIVNSGSGTTFLSGSNTYTGVVAVSAGTISVNSDAALGAAPAFAIPGAITIANNATLQFTDNTTLNATRGIKIAQNGKGTIDVASGKAVTYAGIIAASGTGTTTTFVKSGAGVFNYTGSVAASPNYNKVLVTGGTLDITNLVALPPLPAAYQADWATVNGGTLQFLSSIGTFNAFRGITVGASGGGLASGSGFTNTLSGVITGASGSGALTITGAGSLGLSGVNTYPGGTILSGTGALLIGNNAALGTGNLSLVQGTISDDSTNTARTITNTISIDGNVGIAAAGVLNFTGAVTLTGTRTLTINNSASTTFSGIIGETGGSRGLNKLGTGSMTLTGVNTYTGTFTQSAGITSVTAGSLAGVGAPVNVKVGTLNLLNTSESIGNLTGTAGAILALDTNYALTVVPTAAANAMAANITGATASVTVSGSTFAETFSGTNTFGGGLTVINGSKVVNGSASGLGAVGNAITLGNAGTGGSLVMNAAFTSSTSNVTIGTGGGAINAVTFASTFGNVTGTGTLTQTGTTGSVTVNNLVLPAVAANGGTLKVAVNGANSGTSIVTTVSATGGKLDLTNNRLITATAIGTPTAGVYTAGSVQGMVQIGFNNGGWNGNGIITSQTYAAGNSALTTLAVAKAGDIGYGGTVTFSGQTVNTTDTLVMYTYNGDMNLDGTITGDDYARIDAGFASLGAMSGYENGDLNYDGKINADDYFIIDKNYGHATDLGTFPHGPPVDGLAGVSAVPEPTTLALIGFATAMLRRRRRRS